MKLKIFYCFTSMSCDLYPKWENSEHMNMLVIYWNINQKSQLYFTSNGFSLKKIESLISGNE